MRIWAKAIPVFERSLLVLGLVLLAAFSLAYIHGQVMFRAEMRAFERQQIKSATEAGKRQQVAGVQSRLTGSTQTMNTRNSLQLLQGTKVHRASLGKRAEPIAVLRIPRLHLEVPVLEGTDELTLNQGVGRITGTSRPREIGNIGIAGHRDGFFRVLKDIGPGDSIELVTTAGKDFYGVDRIRITSPADVSALRPSAKPSLTLVTCYPFYFVGPAPKRYIVEASLRR